MTKHITQLWPRFFSDNLIIMFIQTMKNRLFL
jgi:hypothetical protein